MSQVTLLKIINDLLYNIGIDAIDELKPNIDLRKDLEIDSISYAELVVNIESTLGININESGKVETIGEILVLLN